MRLHKLLAHLDVFVFEAHRCDVVDQLLWLQYTALHQSCQEYLCLFAQRVFVDAQSIHHVWQYCLEVGDEVVLKSADHLCNGFDDVVRS